jgi:hypothetical protein
MATTKYYQSNTNNLVKKLNVSDLLIHQKAAVYIYPDDVLLILNSVAFI